MRCFWVGHFDFFFFHKKIFFCFILIQISRNFWGTKDFSKFVLTHWLQLEDGYCPRAVVIAGLLRFSKTVSANFLLAPINGKCMIFFLKFVHTHWLQLEDGYCPRAVVIAGLVRFSKTVSANFHLALINGECMIFFSKFVHTHW